MRVGNLDAMKLLFGFAVAALTVAAGAQSPIGNHPPKLVVLVSIDQFRADYIERYAPYFLPPKSGSKVGGFRFLTETGSNFRDAHHNHIPTATGPGHATLLSGSEPAFDGIAGNEWFDRTLNEGRGKSVYCVDDPNVKTVGGPSSPMSPRNLKVSTVGDELKEATNGKAKVVGVAFKDRAAILMAGHAADTVIWFDGSNANWVTSTWYAPTGQLPAWVDALNKERQVDKLAGKSWDPLLPEASYAITRKAPAEKASTGAQPFSHALGATPDKSLYSAFTSSGYANDYVLNSALRAVDAEKLGQDDVSDLLVINLSTNDYVGHRYGPNSPEVMDVTVRTDRALSDFLNALNKKVPGGLDEVAFVVTADHGVLPIVEESRDTFKLNAQRITTDFKSVVDKALDAKFGAADWVLGEGLYEQNLYLDRSVIAAKGLKPEDVEQTAADAAAAVPGIFAAFTRTQITHGQLPKWANIDMVTNGYNLTLGGDIMVLEGPGMYQGGGTGTGHGSAWAYDSHVPIVLRAKAARPGRYMQRVYTADIAPTLCQILGIEYPTGNVGRPLPALNTDK